MNHAYHKISPTGQLVQVSVSEIVISNPERVLYQLEVNKKALEEGAQATTAIEAETQVHCYYNMGPGLSAFERIQRGRRITWGVVQLEAIPFTTKWQLHQQDSINDGKHFISPSTSSHGLDMGAPMMYQVPEDLIINFIIEYDQDAEAPGIIQPSAKSLSTRPSTLRHGARNFYLSCFSLKRNTCVAPPIPNLFNDSKLCIGGSFDSLPPSEHVIHSDLRSSWRAFAKAWGDSFWNLDLMGEATGAKMTNYCEMVRFDATSGEQLEHAGCDNWDRATSFAPLESIYAPFIK